MPRRNEPANVGLVAALAESLNVDIKTNRTSTQKGTKPGVAQSTKGDFQVNVLGQSCRVMSDAAPGIMVRRIDPTKDYGAPDGALYELIAYQDYGANDERVEGLNQGDVYSVYVGPKGIMLSDSSKKRIVDNNS